MNEQNALEANASEENAPETKEPEVQASEGKADEEYLQEVRDFWKSIFQDEEIKMDYRLRASDLYHRAMRQKAAIDQTGQASKEVRPNPYASLTMDELCKLAKHIA